MDKTDVAGALHEYEEAMTEFLTSVRARDTLADFPLRQRLYAAGIQIERLKLRGTPAYSEAVLRADRNSWPRECKKALETPGAQAASCFEMARPQH
jgi:hypothetical protein